MNRARQYDGEVPGNLAGKRLDQALAEMFPAFSRTRLKSLIEQGQVRVNDRLPRPRDKVSGGEQVSLTALFEPVIEARAQPVPLVIVYEDETLLVIDKPAGLVVHPGAGNPDCTLQNGLLHHAPALSALPRAGIVHRLDKDTSGLMVVAKSPAAHAGLVRALEARDIHRGYEAVCTGVLTAGGQVNAPLGRHPVDRVRMAVRARGGRHAVTHYRVIRRYRAHTHLRLELETGRTHQIRVHLQHLGHPILGDEVYGKRGHFPRHMLHAWQLGFLHPRDG
ncbi:MAG: 23S rRNA pseudouridine(1911/1915/1917) synthase RluD, partial [Gammaproteobacteria bacterium]|nr:23S rRNA pseudouridine(1911/1915/1917) synthase RluD [Gammaproteobacteria bacterium]